jgi:hypothetical protein
MASQKSQKIPKIPKKVELELRRQARSKEGGEKSQIFSADFET